MKNQNEWADHTVVLYPKNVLDLGEEGLWYDLTEHSKAEILHLAEAYSEAIGRWWAHEHSRYNNGCACETPPPTLDEFLPHLFKKEDRHD